MILALDIGTSSTRALLFDRDGHQYGVVSQIEYSQRTTPDGGVEVDAHELWELTARCIDEVLKSHRDVTIEGVACSCFWHSLMAIDAGGKALTPLFSWADNRSAPFMAALGSLLDEDATHARTGCVLHSSYWPAKLLWLRHTQPQLFSSSQTANNVAWIGFGEYLQTQLFGQCSMSLSMASGTGLLEQNTGDWDHQTLRVLPIEQNQLPPIIDCSESLETAGDLLPAWQKRWPALRSARWFPAVGDGACSNIGSGCVDASRVALNVGTSGALRVVLPANEYSKPAPRGLWRYRVNRNRVLLGGAVSNAGVVWAWCRRNFHLSDDIEAQMAQMRPDAHGLTVLPFLAGERSPLWNGEARFALEGASWDTTTPQIARACLEAASLRFAAVFEPLKDALQTLPEQNRSSSTRSDVEVIASGGALRKSRVWAQIVADCLGTPLKHSTEAEASARGAALLALESLGHLDLSKIESHTSETVAPNPAHHEIYTRALERQNALYQKLYG